MTPAALQQLVYAQEWAVHAVDGLRGAHIGTSRLESLALLPLIERAATLARDIGALRAALEADAKGGA